MVNEQGVVKILDMGLARLSEKEAARRWGVEGPQRGLVEVGKSLAKAFVVGGVGIGFEALSVERLIELELDGIITDYPDRLLSILEN